MEVSPLPTIPPANRLKSLDRALCVLECFTLESPEWSTVKISARMELPKGSMHRVLSSLAQRGYLHQHPETRRWRLGLRILELARVVTAHLDVRRLVLPYLEALSREVGENVNLAVRDGTEMVYVERIEGRQFLTMNLRVGSRLPLHCSSMGKVLLAYSPEPERSDLLNVVELKAFTPATITDRAVLMRELDRITQRRYAICWEELAQGLVTAAAPVFDHRGQVVAAMNVSGPTLRMTPGKLDLVIPVLLRTAEQASRTLGVPAGTDGGNGG